MHPLEVYSKQLKAEAHRLGFHLFGVVKPTRPDHFEHYQRWLKRKQFGDMHYLAKPAAVALRRSPSNLFPGCRSIIVLGYPYPYQGESNKKEPHGMICSYALGDDYHRVLKRLHSQLVTSMNQQFPNFPLSFRSTVDSAPVLEKSLAQSAGLGWIGKNGCLINPHYGSFFFLSEIFTNLELPPSPPFLHDFCGKCTRCLDACPSRCISPDRTLIADRCVSYLTIEHNGDIPRHLRDQIGRHIFGCDVCQSVCPWNARRVRNFSEPQPAGPFLDPNPDYQTCLRLTESGFQEMYGHTPLKRTGYPQFLRNVIIAAGNSKALDCIDALSMILLHSDNAALRGACAWSLREMMDPAALKALGKALESER